MELNLTPEAEAKLNALALRTNRGTDELLEEAIENLVSYNEWLDEMLNEGLADIESGNVVPDEEVRAWIEERERSHAR